MIRWFSPPENVKIAGYALVIHGLNLKPERMEAIIDVLTQARINVMLLSLSGHGDNYIGIEGKNQSASRIDTFRQVSYEVWENETLNAYRQVRTAAETRQLPVYFVGYSLGGLLGCNSLVSNDEVRFDKIVLFAPALKMHAASFLLRFLSPISGFVIPSAAPKAYRANNGTPVAAYLAMLHTAAHFKKFINPRLNVPALVFIDKQDELVSYRGLKKLIAEMKLDRWHLSQVEKDARKNLNVLHHLIIDVDSIGIKAWGKMRKRLVEHLNSEP